MGTECLDDFHLAIFDGLGKLPDWAVRAQMNEKATTAVSSSGDIWSAKLKATYMITVSLAELQKDKK